MPLSQLHTKVVIPAQKLAQWGTYTTLDTGQKSSTGAALVNSHVYQADEDGIVYALDDTDAAAADVEGYCEAGDSTPDDKISIAGASSFARGACVEFQVAKDEYWRVENSDGTIRWKPLKNL